MGRRVFSGVVFRDFRDFKIYFWGFLVGKVGAVSFEVVCRDGFFYCFF